MGDIAIAKVKSESVLAFIAGTGPITARWIENYRVLGGFYRFAVGRGFATISPLPTDIPRSPTQLTPYIYTVDELRRLLAATEILQRPDVIAQYKAIGFDARPIKAGALDQRMRFEIERWARVIADAGIGKQ